LSTQEKIGTLYNVNNIIPNQIIHVAIIEDDEEIRNSLAYIIAATLGFHCKHKFVDAESAIKELPGAYVNVVLTDIELPGHTGIYAVKKLKPLLKDVDFIMLSVRQDDEAIFESLCAGATGFLSKDTPPHIILRSIEEVTQGGSPMTASIAPKVITSFKKTETKSPLSKREVEILRFLCEGLNYRTIAEHLFLSGHTVQTHVKNIYRKLEVHSRGQAMSLVIKEDFV
jgi:DNA-binding NarL/FixJ family response regulator